MEVISTFEQIPGALNMLLMKVDELTDELHQIRNFTKENVINEHELLDIDEVCKLTKKKKPTIYRLSSEKLIPCIKKGQKLYFYRDEIIRWIENGKKTTVEENMENARHYIANRAFQK